MPVVPYRSFSAGEVSQRIGARFDQRHYQTGAYRMRNMVPTLEGAAQNRSGTGYVRPCHNFTANDPPRALPFVFSDDQSYVIVLEDQKLSIVSLGEPQFDAAVNISAITQASACKITTAGAHGLTTGRLVWVSGVGGMTQLNNRFFRAVLVDADEFTLQEETGADVDSTGYGAFTAGGTVRAVYQIAAPWAGDDLRAIRVSQSADVMFFTHPDYPVYRLTRAAGPTWTLTAVTFAPAITGPTGCAVSGSAGGTRTRYVVTAVAEDTLEESFRGLGATATVTLDLLGGSAAYRITEAAHGRVTGDRVYFPAGSPPEVDDREFTITVTGVNTYTLDGTSHIGTPASLGGVVLFAATAAFTGAAPSSGAPANVTWTKVTGALEYNIYRELNGIFAYVGTSAGTSFQDLGYQADPFDTPPIDRDVFAAAGDYPVAVALFQQRLLLGGSYNNVERIDAGRLNLLYNFTKSNPIQANDSFFWTMASEKVQGIRHILEMSRCMVFTQSAVFTLEGDDAGALVPTAINPRKRAEHGLGDVAPIAIGNAVLYVQITGKVVSEIIPGTGDDFSSKDLTVYSRHLFDNNAVIAWSYAKEPSSIVWAARDDGLALGFVYLREHEIWGWSRHDTGDGDEIVDVCCVPENGETVTYWWVRRFVGGVGRYYLERMATRQVFHEADGKFLDSYRAYEDANADAGKTYELHYDNALGSDAWYLVPSGSTSPWVEGDASTDIGRVFLLYGPEGERLWCTVTQVSHQFAAYVTVRCDVPGCLNRDDGSPNPADIEPTDDEEDLVPFPFALPYSTNDWSQSQITITDLWHLEGRTVHVVGDGFPQASAVVTDGAITLEAHAVLRVVGLQILADLITLEPEDPTGQTTWSDKTKTVGTVVVRVENTKGLQVGVSLRGLQAYDEKWREMTRRYDEGALYTGRLTVPNLAAATPSGRVYLRQSSGLPTTILGVYPSIEVGDN